MKQISLSEDEAKELTAVLKSNIRKSKWVLDNKTVKNKADLENRVDILEAILKKLTGEDY